VRGLSEKYVEMGIDIEILDVLGCNEKVRERRGGGGSGRSLLLLRY
jgi:hypothetical protein